MVTIFLPARMRLRHMEPTTLDLSIYLTLYDLIVKLQTVIVSYVVLTFPYRFIENLSSTKRSTR